MPDIISDWGNEMRSYHTPIRIAKNNKTKKPTGQVLGRMQNDWNTHILLVGMQNGTATLCNSLFLFFKKSKCTYHMTQQSHS